MNSNIKIGLISIYLVIGFFFAIYQHFWGQYNYKSFANAIKIPITIMKLMKGRPSTQITAMMQIMPASVLMVTPSCTDRTH